MSDADLDLYRRLFVHRSDVYAEQHTDGHYEPVRGVLTDADLRDHLSGTKSYGVYVIEPGNVYDPAMAGSQNVTPRNTVHYLVFDLDTYDADALDFLCRQVERLVDSPKCLLLEDSGGKGYHVWLLLADAIPAARARAFAEPVARRYLAMRRTGHEWPPLEVFPKQDTVPEGGYGNLVKLPLGRHAKAAARSQVISRQGWASGLRDVRPYDVAKLGDWRPAAAAPESRASDGTDSAPFPCISKLLDDGLPEGSRNKAMYHLARYMKGAGVPEDLALEWCDRVNAASHAPMDESEMRKAARSAYAATNARTNCEGDWLEGFCPGGKRCAATWARAASSTAVDAIEPPEQRRQRRT